MLRMKNKKVPFILQGIKYIMLCAVIIHTVQGNCTMEELTIIVTNPFLKVSTKNTELSKTYCINPDSALNLVFGYIHHRLKYIFNKRFYSSEIDIHYKILQKKLELEQIQNSIKRDSYKDTAEQKLNETPLDVYLYKYNRVFIKLFPSHYMGLSINSSDCNTFTWFLKHRMVYKKSSYILAILLLLSEGLDLPVIFTNNKNSTVILEEVIINNKMCFNINTIIISKSIHSYKQISLQLYEKELKEIIEFFMKYKNTYYTNNKNLFGAGYYDEFKRGNILNTTVFLIQSYIYMFLNTVNDIQKFNYSVYEILYKYIKHNKECGGNIKNLLIAQRIFNRYFIPRNKKNKRNSMAYIDRINKLNAIIEKFKEKAFKRRITTELNIQEVQNSIKKRISELDSENTSIENMINRILLVFSLLSYNSKKGKYNPDSIHNMPYEISHFFDILGSPAYACNYNLYKKWQEYFYSGYNKKYLSKNIKSTYNYKDDSNSYINKIYNEHININVHGLIQLKTIKTLIAKHSKLLSTLSAVKKSVFSSIINQFTSKELKSFRCVDLYKSHCLIESSLNPRIKTHPNLSIIFMPYEDLLNDFDSDTSAEWNGIVNNYENSKYPPSQNILYMKFLLENYITKTFSKPTVAQNEVVNNILNILKIRENSRDKSTNCLLIQGNIENTKYKNSLLFSILLYSIFSKTKTDSKLKKFYSNVVGSISSPENNSNINLNEYLEIFQFKENIEYLPNINIEYYTKCKYIIDLYSTSIIYTYIDNINTSAEAIVNYIIKWLSSYRNSSDYILVIDRLSDKNLFLKITENNPEENIRKITDKLKEISPNIKFYIELLWLCISLANNSDTVSILYKSININDTFVFLRINNRIIKNEFIKVKPLFKKMLRSENTEYDLNKLSSIITVLEIYSI
ncbi:hypothetical protein NEPAR04_2449 [Nematocida parisii]|nr:hypothetical protein NEPAR03_0506 [Nematocida parisii]KAI5128258.1 hypothetical protein NEPAR08_1122 [Nematocida parisii]KAI5145437.1 hypothetical protein NEPAR04_2449 [Nematocida parisii]